MKSRYRVKHICPYDGVTFFNLSAPDRKRRFWMNDGYGFYQFILEDYFVYNIQGVFRVTLIEGTPVWL